MLRKVGQTVMLFTRESTGRFFRESLLEIVINTDIFDTETDSLKVSRPALSSHLD